MLNKYNLKTATFLRKWLPITLACVAGTIGAAFILFAIWAIMWLSYFAFPQLYPQMPQLNAELQTDTFMFKDGVYKTQADGSAVLLQGPNYLPEYLPVQ